MRGMMAAGLTFCSRQLDGVHTGAAGFMIVHDSFLEQKGVAYLCVKSLRVYPLRMPTFAATVLV